jgi:hypothetical protein
MDRLPSSSVVRANGQRRLETLGMSRRELLRLAALVTAAGLTGLPLSACGSGAGGSLPVRRDITTYAAAKDIASYKKAITAMKQLPSSDPRNWNNQMMIHLNHCRHASWLFFPWHRAYLFYFEQICRELSGDATFALPYWNWTNNPQIPGIFFDTSSPLFYQPRGRYRQFGSKHAERRPGCHHPIASGDQFPRLWRTSHQPQRPQPVWPR